MTQEQLDNIKNYICFCFILNTLLIAVSTVWIVSKVNHIETILIEQSKLK